jgi:nitrite reductase (NADH) small subunit
MGWVDVANLADVERRKKMVVQVGERPVVLVAAGGKVSALLDICRHKQRELHKGTLLGNRIVCPGHQWAFDLDTGYEAKMCKYQPTFDVRIEDGRVLVADEPRAVPEDEPAEPAQAAVAE